MHCFEWGGSTEEEEQREEEQEKYIFKAHLAGWSELARVWSIAGWSELARVWAKFKIYNLFVSR